MIKTVAVDRDLERHDVMLKSVGKYLKKTKKKLHKYELTLQNQPDLEFAHPDEFVEFDRKLYENLFSDKPAALPSLRKLHKDYMVANPHPIYLSTGEIVLSKEARNAIERDRLSRKVSTRCMDALNEIRKNKFFGKSKAFGTEAEGEVLKVLKIKNPKNEFNEYMRVLTRKRPIHDTKELMGTETRGCGPLKNVDISSIPIFQKKDSAFQIPFKSSARSSAETAEEKKDRLLKHRGADMNPRKTLSPLRERNFSRSIDQSHMTPFNPASGESSIGHRSPISTIRSPGKCNIFPRGFPKDPLQVKIEECSPTSDDGEDIKLLFNTSNHEGKYYFGDTGDFIKSATKESRTAGHVKHVDYTMGALVNRSKGAVSRASASASTFSYGSEDDISVCACIVYFDSILFLTFYTQISERSLSVSVEESIETLSNKELKQSERDREQKLLDLASPTATAWSLKKNKSAFGSPKVAQYTKLEKKESEGDLFATNTSRTFDFPHNLAELRPALRKWYRENEIYSPVRPKTSRFLTEEKKTKYMTIAPELLLPEDYDGETVSIEEAEMMYREFSKSRSEKEMAKSNTESQNGDDVETVSSQNVNSVSSDDQGNDDLVLTELEEMKLYGNFDESGLKNILGGFGGAGLLVSR